jgi:2-C-methyl-D-erythritol 4-phosphate cytidylyltransferase
VTAEFLRDIFHRAESENGVIPVLPCIDTMKVLKKDESGLHAVLGEVADRSRLYGAQTPQIFKSELLKEAYNQAFDENFTDDASVVEKYGKSLSYVIGERLNMKITTQEDLILASAVFSLRNN